MKVSLKRCGDMAVGKPVIVEDSLPCYVSLWWKDVCSIGTNLNNNWFAQNVVKKLGNDTHTSFWDDIWVGNLPLKDRFPRLFSISTQKEATGQSFMLIMKVGIGSSCGGEDCLCGRRNYSIN
jgi:hypothetical protein